MSKSAVNTQDKMSAAPIFHRSAFALTAMLVPLILDWVTKQWAITSLRPLHHPVEIIPGLLQFVYIENTGAAWGMMQDKAMWLALLSLGAMIITVGLVVQAIRRGSMFEIVVYSMLTGGIVGNAIDRLTRGAVVDFIDMYFREWHWPAFNIADTAISISVVLIIGHALFFSNDSVKAKSAQEEAMQNS